MPSKSLLAYADVQEALDSALDSERGIRVRCSTPGRAFNLQQRLYAFRLLDRKRNLGIYNEGDPMYGRSAYDTLLFQAYDSAGTQMTSHNSKLWQEGEAFVQVTKNHPDRLEIEVL